MSGARGVAFGGALALLYRWIAWRGRGNHDRAWGKTVKKFSKIFYLLVTHRLQ
jgi:hypothetical protein